MANRTGSRTCSGSPNQNPVTAFTPTDYDAAFTSGLGNYQLGIPGSKARSNASHSCSTAVR